MSPEVNWSSITYPLLSAYVRNCFVNVRYLRRVAGAIFAPARMTRKAAIAYAIAMRPDSGSGAGAAGSSIFDRPSQDPAASQTATTPLASSQVDLQIGRASGRERKEM